MNISLFSFNLFSNNNTKEEATQTQPLAMIEFATIETIVKEKGPCLTPSFVWVNIPPANTRGKIYLTNRKTAWVQIENSRVCVKVEIQVIKNLNKKIRFREINA